MGEPRFTLHQVVQAVEEGQLAVHKAYRKVLAFRSFTSALVGFMLIGVLLLAQAPMPLAVFGGAGMTAFIFYTMDVTGDAFMNFLKKKMSRSKDDDISSGSDDSSGPAS
jgi:hypothetical protein